MNQSAKLRLFGILFLISVLFGNWSLMPVKRLYAAPNSQVTVSSDVAPAKIVNINTASSEELQTLRGIGPAIAQRIIQYRQEKGAFKKADDLASVRGISGAKFQKIKSQISI